MILNIIPVAIAPSTESENNAFFLVIATGFTAIPLKLFDKGILPSSKKFVKSFVQDNSVLDEYLPWSEKMQFEFKIQNTGYDEDEKGELQSETA